ncbi:class I SAM-dependent methyltransferase [Halopiger djelfimassiliensis]|uniref:class I SAM-dependent methyltransferase n=1 Tax=Halopiger djelfimassiliensis TaxID=1293047 RepID=UPI000677D44E|nr:class I SAM-dependent methyltransferase [Halopiger djelfimassiliensis]
MPDPADHERTVREAFTKQASDYAERSVLSDPEKIGRLIRATEPSSKARVLDVATGPGHVAFGFAAVCDEVVGVDITRAPLEIATERNQQRSSANIHFGQADAGNLPFATASFDIVVCRLAFHHLENPSLVLREMARVCRTGGTVAVADIVVSEFPERASYQNRFERLRDPSHVRALQRSELLALVTEQGIEITDVRSGTVVQNVAQWLDLAQTPEPRADTVRKLIEADAKHDLSGTRPFSEDGELYFTHRTAIVVGRRVRSESGTTE